MINVPSARGATGANAASHVQVEQRLDRGLTCDNWTTTMVVNGDHAPCRSNKPMTASATPDPTALPPSIQLAPRQHGVNGRHVALRAATDQEFAPDYYTMPKGAAQRHR